MERVYRLGLLRAGSLCSVSDGVKQEEHSHSIGLCPELDPELDIAGAKSHVRLIFVANAIS